MVAANATQSNQRRSQDQAFAILRDFENTDKHKLARLTFAAQYQGEVGLSFPEGRRGQAKVLTNRGEIKDGTVLMTWMFERPEPDMNFENIELQIALGLRHKTCKSHRPIWSDWSEASALLTLISKEVRFVVDTVVAAVAI